MIATISVHASSLNKSSRDWKSGFKAQGYSMLITSETTTGELHALYVEGQNFDLDASVVLCRQFIRAARAIHAQIVKSKAKSVEIDGVPVELDARMIERQIDSALAWLSSNDSKFAKTSGSSGSVHTYDLSGIRD